MVNPNNKYNKANFNWKIIMAVIFEYTGGEKKPEINKVLKQSQKKIM